MFLSDQCKEIGENNRIERRDLFKKIRDIKGTFHARMGMIMDRKGKDLTEEDIKDLIEEKIKNRWQEYTEKTIQKISQLLG